MHQESIFSRHLKNDFEVPRNLPNSSALPNYAVSEDLAAGRLIEVLPQWRLSSGGIHAVFPSARFRQVKVGAFVDPLMS